MEGETGNQLALCPISSWGHDDFETDERRECSMLKKTDNWATFLSQSHVAVTDVCYLFIEKWLPDDVDGHSRGVENLPQGQEVGRPVGGFDLDEDGTDTQDWNCFVAVFVSGEGGDAWGVAVKPFSVDADVDIGLFGYYPVWTDFGHF